MRTSLGLLFIYSLTGWKGCGGGVAEKGDVEEEKKRERYREGLLAVGLCACNGGEDVARDFAGNDTLRAVFRVSE